MAGNPIVSHGRMHALDGLRASMMLLGLVIHTVVSYCVVDVTDVWPYNDTATTLFADHALLYIHVFRMPIFFVMAGFFAAMLYLRRGENGLIGNRLQRIGIPFAIGLVILFPLVIGGFEFSNAAKADSVAAGWIAARNALSTSTLYIPDSTLHLWFLYYLLYFYLIAIALARFTRMLPDGLRNSVTGSFRALVKRPVLRVAIPSVVTAATLLPMQGMLSTHTGFLPDAWVLIAYGVFFGFGWLLYRHHDLLKTFMRFDWLQVAASVSLYLVVMIVVLPRMSSAMSGALPLGAALDGGAPLIVQSLMGGFSVWLMFFGATGLFLRYLDRPSRITRYIVDGSYWVYLVHLPIAAWMPGLLVGTDLSVWSRMLIVLATMTALGFATYALFVRATFIGRVLNGRRYPRGLPKVAPTEVGPPVGDARAG